MRAAGAREAGSATVLVLAASTVLLAATAVGALMAGLLAARHRAAAAADLAALSGARHLPADPAAACADAALVAARNGARLAACASAHDAVDLTVAVTVTGPAAAVRDVVQRRARAGPVAAPVPAEGEGGRAPPPARLPHQGDDG